MNLFDNMGNSPEDGDHILHISRAEFNLKKSVLAKRIADEVRMVKNKLKQRYEARLRNDLVEARNEWEINVLPQLRADCEVQVQEQYRDQLQSECEVQIPKEDGTQRRAAWEVEVRGGLHAELRAECEARAQAAIQAYRDEQIPKECEDQIQKDRIDDIRRQLTAEIESNVRSSAEKELEERSKQMQMRFQQQMESQIQAEREQMQMQLSNERKELRIELDKEDQKRKNHMTNEIRTLLENEMRGEIEAKLHFEREKMAIKFENQQEMARNCMASVGVQSDDNTISLPPDHDSSIRMTALLPKSQHSAVELHDVDVQAVAELRDMDVQTSGDLEELEQLSKHNVMIIHDLQEQLATVKDALERVMEVSTGRELEMDHPRLQKQAEQAITALKELKSFRNTCIERKAALTRTATEYQHIVIEDFSNAGIAVEQKSSEQNVSERLSSELQSSVSASAPPAPEPGPASSNLTIQFGKEEPLGADKQSHSPSNELDTQEELSRLGKETADKILSDISRELKQHLNQITHDIFATVPRVLSVDKKEQDCVTESSLISEPDDERKDDVEDDEDRSYGKVLDDGLHLASKKRKRIESELEAMTADPDYIPEHITAEDYRPEEHRENLTRLQVKYSRQEEDFFDRLDRLQEVKNEISLQTEECIDDIRRRVILPMLRKMSTPSGGTSRESQPKTDALQSLPDNNAAAKSTELAKPPEPFNQLRDVIVSQKNATKAAECVRTPVIDKGALELASKTCHRCGSELTCPECHTQKKPSGLNLAGVLQEVSGLVSPAGASREDVAGASSARTWEATPACSKSFQEEEILLRTATPRSVRTSQDVLIPASSDRPGTATPRSVRTPQDVAIASKADGRGSIAANSEYNGRISSVPSSAVTSSIIIFDNQSARQSISVDRRALQDILQEDSKDVPAQGSKDIVTQVSDDVPQDTVSAHKVSTSHPRGSDTHQSRQRDSDFGLGGLPNPDLRTTDDIPNDEVVDDVLPPVLDLDERTSQVSREDSLSRRIVESMLSRESLRVSHDKQKRSDSRPLSSDRRTVSADGDDDLQEVGNKRTSTRRSDLCKSKSRSSRNPRHISEFDSHLGSKSCNPNRSSKSSYGRSSDGSNTNHRRTHRSERGRTSTNSSSSSSSSSRSQSNTSTDKRRSSGDDQKGRNFSRRSDAKRNGKLRNTRIPAEDPKHRESDNIDLVPYDSNESKKPNQTNPTDKPKRDESKKKYGKTCKTDGNSLNFETGKLIMGKGNNLFGPRTNTLCMPGGKLRNTKIPDEDKENIGDSHEPDCDYLPDGENPDDKKWIKETDTNEETPRDPTSRETSKETDVGRNTAARTTGRYNRERKCTEETQNENKRNVLDEIRVLRNSRRQSKAHLELEEKKTDHTEDLRTYLQKIRERRRRKFFNEEETAKKETGCISGKSSGHAQEILENPKAREIQKSYLANFEKEFLRKSERPIISNVPRAKSRRKTVHFEGKARGCSDAKLGRSSSTGSIPKLALEQEEATWKSGDTGTSEVSVRSKHVCPDRNTEIDRITVEKVERTDTKSAGNDVDDDEQNGARGSHASASSPSRVPQAVPKRQLTRKSLFADPLMLPTGDRRTRITVKNARHTVKSFMDSEMYSDDLPEDDFSDSELKMRISGNSESRVSDVPISRNSAAERSSRVSDAVAFDPTWNSREPDSEQVERPVEKAETNQVENDAQRIEDKSDEIGSKSDRKETTSDETEKKSVQSKKAIENAEDSSQQNALTSATLSFTENTESTPAKPGDSIPDVEDHFEKTALKNLKENQEGRRNAGSNLKHAAGDEHIEKKNERNRNAETGDNGGVTHGNSADNLVKKVDNVEGKDNHEEPVQWNKEESVQKFSVELSPTLPRPMELLQLGVDDS